MLQKIIAIGGHSLRRGRDCSISQRIVKLSGKISPHILFIPTASRDDQAYIAKFIDHYTHFKASVDLLCLYSTQLTVSEMQQKIDQADVVYVGGGNTLRMMNLWRKVGLDKLLKQACKHGKVLVGSSAGSICWFESGNSDSRKNNNPDADYINVRALGCIPAMHCPHYDSESDRKISLKKMVKKYSGVAIALDDHAAIEIIGDTYKIITAQDSAQGYKVYWKNNIFYEDTIEKSNEYASLSELLRL